jgi:tRNA (cytidine/uridine-2'-O-)-methyltransferase
MLISDAISRLTPAARLYNCSPLQRLDGSLAARHPHRVKYDPLFHVVLHQPDIPQNAGNVGRTCVAVGAKLWLVRPLGFRVDDHHLRRAGLDYWKHLEWEIVENWETLTHHLEGRRFWYFTKRATRLYTTADYQPGDVLVFGSETQGLPASLADADAATSLRIPNRPQVRSLNLASAAAAVIFEAVRQVGAKF